MISYFDYFDPRAEVVDCLLLGNEGWIPVEVGASYVLRASVKTDQPAAKILAIIRQSDGRRIERSVSVGTEWTVVELRFKAERPFVCVGVGPDLRGQLAKAVTTWIDAVQLSQLPAENATAPDYRTREPVELFLKHRSLATSLRIRKPA